MNELEAIRRFSSLLPPAPPEVLVPPGDDCAVVRLGEKRWVAASDMIVSGRHFKDWALPEDVGYKAVAVNVSDVAAMGAIPRFILVSGGAKEAQTTLRCMEGVLRACEAFGVYPLGGDTTSADALTVDVSILGELAGEAVPRSGAHPGDLLVVTGELGASAAGFLALEAGDHGPERLVEKHLRPEPRVEAGLKAATAGARAMIDLSDGLASDARHVCEQSGVGCRIELGKLPIAEDTRRFLTSLGQDPEVLASTGGEDYELLISAPEDVLTALAGELDIPLTVIGSVTHKDIVFLRGGESVEDLSGWDHFG